MEQLAERIGMAVSIARHPKQNEILTIAEELLPPSWGVAKTPSIHMDSGLVGVKPAPDATINPQEAEAIGAKLEILTGYRLSFR
ncbi:hypothetical protein [Cohnella zeiphila]|uniref:Uncharacterized protein n=1 Tax=Cohnella zeiphila TaxID=2761120 RepID=A0A7X0SLI8_9BACL|nr:hypothetical protein [Cohnella zeiphila]MBB6732230.1 hypothetical protein [Cohnella zeiphila]